jgi:glycyl-tRNA synthetase beta chain
VLILTMKANQKYFPLLDDAGRLTNRFLVVSNIRPADPRHVVEGNERVVRPRLADAKFFFDQDRKRTLESRLPGLDQVVYHARLGTQGERARRVRALAEAIGERLGGAVLAAETGRAAALAKADLLTDMVGEFPELQGTMGRYYASHDGEPDAVALAIEDHYKPRFAGDSLPRTASGRVVALADKLETLVGLFGIGQLPSGDKDPVRAAPPCARRRPHADGASLPLALDELLEHARSFSCVAPAPPRVRLQPRCRALREFIEERLAGLLREQGYAVQEIDAVLALQPSASATSARLAAVRAFCGLPEAASLAAPTSASATSCARPTGGRPACERRCFREPAERPCTPRCGGASGRRRGVSRAATTPARCRPGRRSGAGRCVLRRA